MIIVLDSTIIVSAFLSPRKGAISYDLLQWIYENNAQIALSHDILEESKKVLLYSRLRAKYNYEVAQVNAFLLSLSQISKLITELPSIKVVRDENDDVILATAIKAKANFLLTRDKDLLTLNPYQKIAILSPEVFMAAMRKTV